MADSDRIGQLLVEVWPTLSLNVLSYHSRGRGRQIFSVCCARQGNGPKGLRIYYFARVRDSSRHNERGLLISRHNHGKNRSHSFHVNLFLLSD